MGRRPGSHIRNPLRGPVSSQVSSWLNFNPLSFGPSLWMDASDTATITESGGAVSQWDDKSPNGYHFAQSTAARQPTTGTRTVNDRNAIDFDGGDSLFRNSTSVVNQSDGTFTVFSVVLSDAIVGVRSIFSGDSLSAPRGPQFLRTNSASLESIRIANFAGTQTVVSTSLANVAAAGRLILAYCRLDAANLQVFADSRIGASNAATGGATATAQLHEIGASGNHTALFDGAFCEIIVYPLALTDPQMNVVAGYLRAKWGTA